MTDSNKQAHILVVDDDEIIRIAASASLSEAGFEVTEAENGVQALQILENAQPDIILLDVMMPEMDGFATARAIRQLAGCEMIPILIMTALEDLDSINKAYDAGATDFVTKPLNWVILVQRVRYMTRSVQIMNAQKQLQAELQQAQKLEAVATLVGGLAHDFNNLMHVILGSAELMRMYHPDVCDSSGELKDIIEAVGRGSKLVRQLLTYSRKIKSEKRPIRLNVRVRQVKELLQRTIPKMIEIECRLGEGLHLVSADSIQMEQVMINLAINAKDAMPDGGRLMIATANVGENEKVGPPSSSPGPLGWVRLTVSDNGHGMGDETRKHVFEPFFSTKAPGKGTGLGLSMVHGIVQNHDGKIICRSAPGKGTAFHIYLPAVEAVEERVTPTDADDHVGGNEILLMVDDDDITLATGKKQLEKAGYTVITATDGEKALKIYSAQKDAIDLVLLDLMMPGMGGAKCLQALYRLEPKVKVIITSGHYPEGRRLQIIEECARACLHKPYPTSRLLATIREVLDANGSAAPSSPKQIKSPRPTRTPDAA
ncbi:MAG: response regulator [Desulfobacterales bacterium]|nr:response regulator [Desulfobacterales bacterium]